MPLDPTVRRFLDRLAATNPTASAALSVAARREALEQMLSLGGKPPALAAVSDQQIPGPAGPLQVRCYTPIDVADASSAGLVFLHGGGLIAGSLETHDGICRSLAVSVPCRLLAVDYRLAPEQPFPCGLEDAIAAVVWIARNAPSFGIDPARLAVGGDSAGATLAAAACQAISARKDAPLRAQFLLCPIMDFAASTASWNELGQGYMLDRGTLQHDLQYYLPEGVSASDPRVSPLRALDVTQLPPTCLHTAEFDPLRDEGLAYVQRLQTAGIATRYRCHLGMIHLFYGMGALFPYAATAYRLMGEDLRALLG